MFWFTTNCGDNTEEGVSYLCMASIGLDHLINKWNLVCNWIFFYTFVKTMVISIDLCFVPTYFLFITYYFKWWSTIFLTMIKFPPNPDPFPAPSLWSVTLYHCSVPGRDDPPREPPSASAWLRRTSPTSSRNTASRTATTAATRTATSLVSVPTSLTNIYHSRVQRANVPRCSGVWL